MRQKSGQMTITESYYSYSNPMYFNELLHTSEKLFMDNGAEGRTRTGTPRGTAPSRQRVYLFHHFG